MKMSHRLTRHDIPTAPAWPSFAGTSQYAGTSPSGRVTVFVDPTLGAAGMQNAQDLAADGDRIMAGNDALFGTQNGDQVSVIVYAIGGATDGTGGADHMACDFVNGGAIEVCASFGNSIRCSALLEAEVSECSMGGNLCGFSNGEALSRWCAMALGSNSLSDFATAPTWQADGMADFVDTTEQTDQDPDATGCGMAFLSWLQSLGCSLPVIAQAMVSLGDGGTLAALYNKLTGDAPSNAWSKFQTVVAALPGGVTSDDPFGALGSQPAPAPAPAPTPAPSPPCPPPTEVTHTLDEAVAILTENWSVPAVRQPRGR